jgi:HSP20 family protein
MAAPNGEDLAMLTTRARTSNLDRMMSLNRALDQAITSAWTTDNRVWIPAIDIVEKRDAYVLYAELPGMDASQIEMSFEKSVLTIRGTKPSQLENGSDGEIRVYAAERASGSFERSVRLPEFVDGNAISADLTNGLLVVTIPKAQAAQPRRIEINGVQNTERHVSQN